MGVALFERVAHGFARRVDAGLFDPDVADVGRARELGPRFRIPHPAAAERLRAVDEAAVHLDADRNLRPAQLVVPPRDPSALAAAVQKLLDQPELRVQMGAAGLERVLQEFTSDKMVDRVLAVYADLLGKSREK